MNNRQWARRKCATMKDAIIKSISLSFNNTSRFPRIRSDQFPNSTRERILFDRSSEAEAVGISFESCNDTRNDFVQWHSQLFGAVIYLFAIDRARERFVFHLLFHRTELDVVYVLTRSNEGDRNHESAQFVYRAQRFLHVGFRDDPGIIRMR